MKQSQLAKLLKCITIFVGVLGIVFSFCIVPSIGKDVIRTYPEFTYLFWPYLIWVWAAAIPCCIALINLWKICCEIAKDNSFCRINSKALQSISRLALFDTMLVLTVSILFFLFNMLHPGFLIASFFVAIGGLAVSIVSAVLSHWVEKGRKLKDENDLTI